MIQDLLLHIGLPKTGSTSVQEALVAQPASTMRDARLHFPVWNLPYAQAGNHTVPLRLLANLPPRIPLENMDGARAAAATLWEQTLREHQQMSGSRLLLSAEGLGLHRADEVKRFREWLMPFLGANARMQIGMWTRKPMDWLRSLHNEHVKQGYVQLGDWETPIRNTIMANIQSFEDIKATWQKAFPFADFQSFAFEQPLEQQWSQWLGLNRPFDIPLKRENPSLTWEAMLLLETGLGLNRPLSTRSLLEIQDGTPFEWAKAQIENMPRVFQDGAGPAGLNPSPRWSQLYRENLRRAAEDWPEMERKNLQLITAKLGIAMDKHNPPRFEFRFRENPHEMFAQWGQQEPFKSGNQWVIVQHHDAKTALRFKQVSKQFPNVSGEGLERSSVLFRDAPDHGRIRGVATKHLTPDAIASLQAELMDELDLLVAELPESGKPWEFVEQFASRIPSLAVGILLGIPKEHHSFMQTLAHRYVEASDPENAGKAGIESAENIREGLLTFFENMLGERSRSGLLNALMQARDEKKLSHLETLTFASSLVIGGLETSANVFSTGMKHLIEHPELQSELRENPSRMSIAVEEMLRLEPSALYSTYRKTTAPLQLSTVTIPEGEEILVAIAAANRDPKVFPAPNEMRLDRTENPHLSFGGGSHFCLGSWLVRMELTEAFNRLLQRYDRLEFAARKAPWPALFRQAPPPYVWRKLAAVRGLECLHIVGYNN